MDLDFRPTYLAREAPLRVFSRSLLVRCNPILGIPAASIANLPILATGPALTMLILSPPPPRNAAGAACQLQPSSFIAQPAFQIFVMWRILSPEKSMT